MLEENAFCKNSANWSITGALLVAIVCFGRGRWETKILDQNLTLLEMIMKDFLAIRQTEILLYKPVLVWILCIRFSRKHRSPDKNKCG